MWMQRNYPVRILVGAVEHRKAETHSVLRYRGIALPYFYPTGSANSRRVSRGLHRRENVRMDYLKAFLAGGTLCLIGQILIDKTKLTPARILVSYVVIGVFLGAIGLYEPFAEFAGAGASVPLTGFGNTLAKGVREAVDTDGFLGIFTGGLKATAGGITAAVVISLVVSFLFKAKDKS